MIEITNISQFDEILKTKPEIKLKKEMVDGIEVGIICYMIEDTNTFNSELARECRGITFRLDTGEVVARPFHKFYNINQKEFTLERNIDWSDVRYYTKYDGSLAIPVLINNKVFWKTKKSFYSEVAKQIQKFYDSTYDKKRDDYFKYQLKHEGMTQLFEFTSQENRVVIDYKEPTLHYLCSRDNLTGEYKFNTNWKELKIPYQQFLKETSEKEDIEGYVLWNGIDLYKAKTNWYMTRHRALSQISVKTIIQMYIDQTLDDVISNLYTYGYVEKAKWIENLTNEFNQYVMNELTRAEIRLEELRKKYKRTELRTQVAQEPLNSVIFNLLDERDPMIVLNKRMKDYFRKKYSGKTFFMGEEV